MSREEFTALLGAGTEYQGQLTFKGTVRIDGRFVGVICSEGKLILGKDAKVEGTITVNELVVHGALTGEIQVGKRSVLYQTAQVSGTLNTPLLTMEEGALLQGELLMRKESGKKIQVPVHHLNPQADHGIHDDINTPVKQ
jgi:cytoskeletal protein CcmA (bactofilin family)